MTGQIDEDLEKQLAALTTWQGDAPQLWRRALAAVGLQAKPRRSRSRRMLSWRFAGKLAACVAVVALWATVMIVNLPHLGGRSSRDAARVAPLSGGLALVGRDALQSADRFVPLRARSPASGLTLANAPTASTSGEHPQTPPTVGVSPSERHVTRQATIELRTDDVRAAFLKAAMIVREAAGEYVQDSSLTGSGDEAFANLTLRVAADRLSEVLNELRQLGEVHSERKTGQDVTSQVVDLEARLRNEQRVEVELLRLLETRQDASLEDVLALRGQLSKIRQEIERLTAQRVHLDRLVSLATVLVLVRGGDTPFGRGGSSLGTYFADACGNAWSNGLVFLADTLATLLSILVGGLIWWVLLVGVVLGIWHWRRRAKEEAMATPRSQSASRPER